MIEVNHITKRFGKVTAVDDFTLDINRGSVLGIVGSNGGGKSTLLRILSGVFDADSGEVKINGQNIYNNPSVKGECFFIPDFPYFSNSATLENTAYLYRSLYPNWNENAFRQFCSVFPIDPDAKIIDMSKGMQRQAALILAISTCPRYLLLDEIFDGLDPVVRRLVKKILIDNVSANDMTVVIASHNLRELEELCDRICLIHKRASCFLSVKLTKSSLDSARFRLRSRKFPTIRSLKKSMLSICGETEIYSTLQSEERKMSLCQSLRSVNLFTFQPFR